MKGQLIFCVVHKCSIDPQLAQRKVWHYLVLTVCKNHGMLQIGWNPHVAGVFTCPNLLLTPPWIVPSHLVASGVVSASAFNQQGPFLRAGKGYLPPAIAIDTLSQVRTLALHHAIREVHGVYIQGKAG
jgi:hypothetical protein